MTRPVRTGPKTAFDTTPLDSHSQLPSPMPGATVQPPPHQPADGSTVTPKAGAGDVSGLSASSRKLGIVSASATLALSLAYAIPLTAGLISLPSPDAPIGEPWFAMMEILIIFSMPAMVGLMVAVHAWAPPGKKVFGVLAVVFMSLVTVLTCSVHFVILTVSHRDEFAGQAWLPSILSFRWLSITYALDILAWDVFFALAVLSAAAVFAGNRLARSIRLLMTISGVLALAGLSGVVLDDARARNIGIAGYAVVFPVAALLLAILFHRATPHETTYARS